MIAPLKPSQPRRSETQDRLRVARRVVAQSLLPPPQHRPAASRVPAWKVGLLTVWIAVTAACYVARLLGLWD